MKTTAADAVRALVAAKYPGVLESPLAQAMNGASAVAMLEASDPDEAIRIRELMTTARKHAERCLAACDGWTVETLSVQIECATDGELDAHDCDDLAAEILGLAA